MHRHCLIAPITALLAAAFPGPLRAQVPAADSLARIAQRTRALSQIRPGKMIRIYSPQVLLLQGTLIRRDSASIVIASRFEGDVRAAIAPIDSIWRRRTDVDIDAGNGALLGLAFGALGASALQSITKGLCENADCRSSRRGSKYIVRYAIEGTFVGAGIGALIGKSRKWWEIRFP